MGTDADAGHAGLKENARAKPYHSAPALTNERSAGGAAMTNGRRTEFDKKYNPTWHCIVGRNFGSYVTHETKHFIYFYLGQVAILLFKSG
ncbi:hypothetical protein AV530_018283 [Patagioenas fasciata monilis]|uniref:Dynein light chain n=1 Tax=Patagioenas fasciata monilis TaxID=372326 RepID=A0A1V4JRL2_PATFA|nr:hypothetical protein AV530_018283 [Patagioenas fasciata monilis]